MGLNVFPAVKAALAKTAVASRVARQRRTTQPVKDLVTQRASQEMDLAPTRDPNGAHPGQAQKPKDFRSAIQGLMNC